MKKDNDKPIVLGGGSVSAQPSTSSDQLSLFRQFVTNNIGEVTNSIPLWETIPKYFFTREIVKRLRRPDGKADPFKWQFESKGKHYQVTIKPAVLEDKDGNFIAEFPGLDEELIEEVLKKIVIDRADLAIHDGTQLTTMVKFNTYMIRKELQRCKKTRNATQVRRSIDIMSNTIITVVVNGSQIYQSTILSELFDATKGSSMIKTGDAESKQYWVARLPSLMSYGINQLDFRQTNYKALMGGKNQLTRWIYRKFVNNFQQASTENSYNFMYSDIKKTSALLQAKKESNNRDAMIATLDELIDLEVIESYIPDERREGVKIVDIKYTIRFTAKFTRNQKASNKNAKLQRLLTEDPSIIEHDPQ